MRTRIFGATNRSVSEVGLGTWQLGAGWGNVSEEDALATLRTAYDSGVTFFDTADVYGMGRSESLIARFLRETPGARERVYLATKLGRFSPPGWPENFTRSAVRQHTEASLKRLDVDAVDLTQLHCIPPDVLRRGEMLGWLDELKREGKIRGYGVSVESMDEAAYCLDHGGVTALQIIFNVLRQKPIHSLFAAARAQSVGLIVRLPLASGLLGGRMTRTSRFAADDHRNFNRNGEQFNVGETFAGLPFELGVDLAESLKRWVPTGWSLSDFALRWCLDFEAVGVIIPGARTSDQARANARASDLPPLGAELHVKLASFYEREVAPHIRGPY